MHLKVDSLFFSNIYVKGVFSFFLYREIAGITVIFVLVSVVKRETVFVVLREEGGKAPRKISAKWAPTPPIYPPIGVLVVERDVSGEGEYGVQILIKPFRSLSRRRRRFCQGRERGGGL